MFTTHATNLQSLVRRPQEASQILTDLSIRRCTTSSITASTTTDNCIANVTVSNGVVLPNSKQGTFWVTSANSNIINIATTLPEEMLIHGAVEPVPFATNYLYPSNYRINIAFRIQFDCTNAPLQFVGALGSNVHVNVETTSGIFDVNQLFTGHKMIHIKNNYGETVGFSMSST